MRRPTDLVVPVKNLARAKSRLRGATTDPRHHEKLVLALALDTVGAASGCPAVRRILVVTPDPQVHSAMDAAGFECLEEVGHDGLNAALTAGARTLRKADPGVAVGALQADLPALRASELAAAIEAFHDGAGRGFCTDRAGTGTTLLLAPGGHELDPCFGPGSADAHRLQGATALRGAWPGLRLDVDTPTDLADAAALGLGPRSAARFRAPCPR